MNATAAQGSGNSDNQEAAIADRTNENAVSRSTGHSFVPLTPETIQSIITLQIQSGETPSTPEDLQQRYAELRKEHFNRIATDLDYAAKEAKLLGTGSDGLLIPNDVFEKFAAEGRYDELGYALDDANNPVLQVQKQRNALYEREVAEGVPPAQIYKDLLEFNLSLPDSYTDGILDSTDSYPPGYYKSLQRSELDLLNAALAQAPTSTEIT